ncbi:cell envelope integrity protein TolA [Tepidicella baoligensis]|uniref:cell envelope integrity protein TolA n=1 Tax=Tepidicella baoligensis TaxID=2707016 RepID=UPI001FEA7788|nr:cell envelope integrity protein TolA [Tepidicella baoligensis]
MQARGDDLDLNPPAPGRWGGPLTLALGVHGLLLLALAWGVAWQKDTEAVLEAELWSRLPQVAAPRIEEPPPAPPPRPAPPPPAPAAPLEADIALQRAQEQARLEEQRRLEQQRAEERRREEQRRAEEARRQAEREAAERRAAEERRRQEEQRAQQARERAEQERRERELQAQLEAQRQRNLERMMSQAGATGAPASTGSASQSAGPSASYAGRLVATIRPNIVFTDWVPGNPRAEVELRTLPDGTIVSARLRQSSGHPSWDAAVLRAIERTGRLPRDENGRVPSTLILGFRPQD